MVLMRTEMGQGVDFMMNSHAWHGIAPNDEQLKSALAQLEETWVTIDVHWKNRCRSRRQEHRPQHFTCPLPHTANTWHAFHRS
jgi:transketolase